MTYRFAINEIKVEKLENKENPAQLMIPVM